MIKMLDVIVEKTKERLIESKKNKSFFIQPFESPGIYGDVQMRWLQRNQEGIS